MSENHFHPFPTFETQRLRIDRLIALDAQRLYELRTSDDVMRYVERPRPESVAKALETIQQTDELIESGNGIAWAIRLKTSPDLIGIIGFWRMKREHFRAEIGYMLLPKYWRQGITSEAMAAILDYAFNVLNLHSVEADINPENTGSKQILLKSGFSKEAYFRENFFWQGKFYDSEIYGILASEFNARK